ncbi:MAG: hypothetical protein E7386_03445 [Ruminococcaceae bacterium]|nr:hypothetical protein [Oscillospiraceae bacterium]
MKRTVAAFIFVAMVLTAVAAGFIFRKRKPVEASAGAPQATVSTTKKEEKVDDRYEAGPRATEPADYGDGTVADICELMKNLTGKKYYLVSANIEELFACRFEKEYYAYYMDYVEYPQGEKVYSYFKYMNVSKDGLEFNRFILTANQEYGNVYMIEFIASTSKHDNSLKPLSRTEAELQQYYMRLEKELTALFGKPEKSSPVDTGSTGKYAWADFKISNECTFSLTYQPEPGEGADVKLKCYNSEERKHYLIGGEADKDPDPGEFDKNNYYKEAGKDDIVTDEKTGYRYVKNQLLVSFTAGTPNDMEKMEKICKELGAKIVGYLQVTSDFQIEFDRDMTCEELLKIAEELKEKYYFVSSASLNFAVDYGEDSYD